MSVMASQITSLTIVYATVYSGADQRKHQSSASLAFVRGIHRWPVNSRHKGPVTWKMSPFDDVIIKYREVWTKWSIFCRRCLHMLFIKTFISILICHWWLFLGVQFLVIQYCFRWFCRVCSKPLSEPSVTEFNDMHHQRSAFREYFLVSEQINFSS